MRSALAAVPSIRRASPADEAFTALLGGIAFRDFDPRALEHTLALMRGAAAATLVACVEQEPLGFAVVELARDGVALLQAIAVEPRVRGCGIGTALLRAAEQHARAIGCPALRLCTAQANVEALDLFLKHGFRIEHRLARFYTNGQDACTLVKRLAPGAT
jgi:[ribosomal protein S18]-alanine N-acetyltransferase